ncbi:MAG: TerD family protein [Desertifilum sp.]|nr:TerD family protein [Desertifilum sp.]
MGTQLVTGERFDLSQAAPEVKQVAVGLGWQVTQVGGQAYDIDASVFMIGADGKIPDERYFVFYNNLVSQDGSVRHLANRQSRTSDQQTITVDLTQVNPAIEEIIIVVTIHDAKEKRQNFSQVRDAYIRLYNPSNEVEIARYNLTDQFDKERALEFGKFYKRNGKWRFQAVGQGYNMGLQSFVDKYYVETPAKAEVGVRQPESFEISSVDLLASQVDKAIANANLGQLKARIGCIIEASPAMQNWITGGNLQTTLERLLALSKRLETSPAVDVWLFAETFQRLPSVIPANVDNYVKQQVLPVSRTLAQRNAANYAPVMVDLLQKYLQEDKRKYPNFATVLGSGLCSDAQKAEYAVRTSSKYPVFWQFFGITDETSLSATSFEFLRSLDILSGRRVDNASFVELNSLSLTYEDEFYNKLFIEFPYWLIEAQAQGII